jgi:hypothetical protein
MQRSFWLWFVLLNAVAGLSGAAARDLTLSWNPSADPTVKGYHLYYGTSSGHYTNQITVGNVTTATVSNLAAGVTYYFSATAFDSAGTESDFSNETSFIVPGVLALAQNPASGQPPQIRFPVEAGHWYEVQATSDLKSWVTIATTAVATTNEWFQCADPDTAAHDSRFYRLVLH